MDRDWLICVLQNIVVVIIALLVGALVFGVSMLFLTAYILGPKPGEDPSLAWGSAIGAVFGGGCGAVLGATIGLTVALRWIVRHGHRVWNPIVWIVLALALSAILGATWMWRITQ
jgi:hypothetical protein